MPGLGLRLGLRLRGRAQVMEWRRVWLHGEARARTRRRWGFMRGRGGRGVVGFLVVWGMDGRRSSDSSLSLSLLVWPGRGGLGCEARTACLPPGLGLGSACMQASKQASKL
ncbi:uncharacterized protein K452DRAFT_170561 [Aplosporella prunicola CBS 121167]|uniref:Uncharacterized protein n=1 Tax=Aplosporella prunicola CBS 121167 TaxID=1176127 RepID=A0A6A6BJF1_9PEZI|nr:uncharacterized protein K452DRAFT_170561 [Aplosporella prunicola CBS 121167]KAF2143404.1 hypothetical protein K452DRAFT_170561 [Aplosporella prunicola CBS 121167]